MQRSIDYDCVLAILAGHLPALTTLMITNNRLESLDDVRHLGECKTLRVLDLSHNKIDDAGFVEV